MKVGVLGCNGFLGGYFLQQYKWIPITREEVVLLDQKSVETFFEKSMLKSRGLINSAVCVFKLVTNMM